MRKLECPELNLDRFNRTKTAIENIHKQAEVDKKLLMFDVGDFDPRHYEMIHSNLPCEYIENGVRFEVSVKFKYAAKPSQRAAAWKRLKATYGKKWEKLIPMFHPLAYKELYNA